MPVYKKKLAKGRVSWLYLFEVPGPTRRQIKEGGFASKKEATDAEAARRLKETAAAKKASGLMPKTLADVLAEWLADRGPSLSPKTAVRYAELTEYLSPEIAGMPIAEVTPLHLHREWKRLMESGGHHRTSKVARPLSAKTVRHIAGTVSSAFAWAILYGIVTTNPVTHSQRPTGAKRKPVALAPSQTKLMLDAADGQWFTFLEVEAALGARRGEVLALRWSDIADGVASITRSLGQAKDRTYFKGTKTGQERAVGLPPRTLAVLADHRQRQEIARMQFGADYRKDLDLIFAQPDGEPLKPDSVSSKISLMCRRLKLPKGASLHSLRHGHVSQLLADGVPVTNVSERVGHSNAHTTLGIYGHAMPGGPDLGQAWADLQDGKGKKN